jgi:hypothetical protein
MIPAHDFDSDDPDAIDGDLGEDEELSYERLLWQLLLLINPCDEDAAREQFHAWQEMQPDGVHDEADALAALRQAIDWKAGFLRGSGVARIEKAEEVAGAAQRRRDRLPAIDAAGRAGDHLDPRVVVQRLGRLQRLPLARGGEEHRVAAGGQAADDSFEVSRLSQVVDEEQDPQGAGCGDPMVADAGLAIGATERTKDTGHA